MIRPAFFAAGLAVLVLAMPAAAQQQQVRFTGRTTVDAVVIRDALRQVLMVAAAREGCPTIEAVEADVLPEGYEPPESYRIAATRYERWDVTMCGRVVPFLLGFWHPPEGGTMFQIGYPFPQEPAVRR